MIFRIKNGTGAHRGRVGFGFAGHPGTDGDEIQPGGVTRPTPAGPFRMPGAYTLIPIQSRRGYNPGLQKEEDP